MFGTIGFIVSCIAVPIIYGVQQHDYHERAREACRDYNIKQERFNNEMQKIKTRMEEEEQEKIFRNTTHFYWDYICMGYAHCYFDRFHSRGIIRKSAYCEENPLSEEDLKMVRHWQDLGAWGGREAFEKADANSCIAYKRDKNGFVRNEYGSLVRTTEDDRWRILYYDVKKAQEVRRKEEREEWDSTFLSDRLFECTDLDLLTTERMMKKYKRTFERYANLKSEDKDPISVYDHNWEILWTMSDEDKEKLGLERRDNGEWYIPSWKRYPDKILPLKLLNTIL